jgi:hypothetical protein
MLAFTTEHTNYWAEHHRVGPVLVSVAATSGTVRYVSFDQAL